ncbi:MAG: hypothetical protein PHO42_00465 [Candidatus Omnitrophica bacterium]|nr:hypothetical protein [Candidatus Omnitrophota bacterium]
MTSICILGHFLNLIFGNAYTGGKSFLSISAAFLIALFLSQEIIMLITAYHFPTTSSWASCLNFGLGGGQSVADVFSLIIPTAGRLQPRASYLAKMGFPVTTGDLPVGLDEGVVYLGTVICGLICVLLILGIVDIFRRPYLFLTRLKLKGISKLYLNISLTPGAIIGISAFLLYILSWGHVVHIFGHRIDAILFTPAGILAELHRRLFYIRSMGRLAIPFALYILIATIFWLNQYLVAHREIYRGAFRKRLCAFLVFILIALHVYEVRGYIKPAEVTPKIILNIFNNEEINVIKSLLKGKKALFLVPGVRDAYTENDIIKGEYASTWDKKCFALALYSEIPTNLEYDLRISSHSEVIKSDKTKILEGDLAALVDKYGDIAIASPLIFAESILERTDIPLRCYKMQNFAILVPIKRIKGQGGQYE